MQVPFGEHCCAVALGTGIDGTKQPLSLVEGSTEYASLVRDLIVGPRERGLDVTRPILVVLDGSKALRRGARCLRMRGGRNSPGVRTGDELSRRTHERPGLAARRRRRERTNPGIGPW